MALKFSAVDRIRQRRPLIYIAGPITGGDYIQQRRNINAGAYAAAYLWKKGASVICPHLNTDFGAVGAAVDREAFIQGDLEQIRRCDAVYFLPGWKHSTGAKDEHEFCLAIGVPIFYNLGKLMCCHVLPALSAIQEGWQDPIPLPKQPSVASVFDGHLRETGTDWS